MLARYLYFLHQARSNLRMQGTRLRKMQERRLKAAIRHAYQTVPFYHRKLDLAGIRPQDIQSVDDLAKIPFTTKEEIQAAPVTDVVSKDVCLDRCIKTTTSGSTGLPLTVFLSSASEDFRGALWARAFWENGLRLRDRVAVIRDPHFFSKRVGFFERLGMFRRMNISVFDVPEFQLAQLEAFSPNILRGYPSSLAILADLSKSGSRLADLRLVFTGSELLSECDRRSIASTFQCELLDYYGSIEFGLLAWECKEHTGYHMNVDGAVIEFVRDGEPVSFGERGEVVCTSLDNDAMPLLRYRLGDEGVPVEECCPSHTALPLVKMLEGRSDDFVMTLDGRRVSPLVFGPFPFENLEGIRQFRVIQEKRDKLKLQIVLAGRLPKKDQIFREAKERIQKLFGEKMQVDFEVLDRIQRDKSGKIRNVISRVRS